VALMCPVELDVATLKREIQTIYGRVATSPAGQFHFHRGPAYAVERLGYDVALLATLPADTTASFAALGDIDLWTG
jgi:arsenite methyltransferase